MAGFDFDLFVIGAGSGGVRAARMAAAAGARVGVAEERHLGGTCVNVGCVPKKLLSYAAHYGDDFEDAAAYGWEVATPRFDWSKLIANKNHEIARLNGIYQRLLQDAGVQIFDARATLVDRHTLAVGDRKVTAARILVATGGRPSLPMQPGAREYGITSDEAFFLPELPRRALIAGGGFIAVEFAGIFRGLGAEVIQLYRGDLFLRGFDDDIRTTLAEEMAKRGIDLRFNTIIERIEKAGNGRLQATLTGGAVEEVDCVLYAIGRNPNTAGLGLEAAGVALDADGAIIVDATYRTSVDNIYALGDVTNRIQLTPVAIAEAMCLVDNLYRGQPGHLDYADIPVAVFSHPPVGTVGLTEAEGRAAFGQIDVYRTRFRPMRHTMTGRNETTMMKLVVDSATDRVLGCHIVGADAPEMVQAVAIALKCRATKAQFDATIGIHPTAAEELVTLRSKVQPVRAAAE